MRHPPSHLKFKGGYQGDVYGGVYVIVMEWVINVVKYWHEPIYLLYETNSAQNLVILFWGILLKLLPPCRCHILQLKCTKFDFGCGSASDPAGGAYSAPSDPLAGFKGPTSKGRGGAGRGWKGGGGGGGRGKGRDPWFWVTPPPWKLNPR